MNRRVTVSKGAVAFGLLSALAIVFKAMPFDDKYSWIFGLLIAGAVITFIGMVLRISIYDIPIIGTLMERFGVRYYRIRPIGQPYTRIAEDEYESDLEEYYFWLPIYGEGENGVLTSEFADELDVETAQALRILKAWQRRGIVRRMPTRNEYKWWRTLD